MTREPLAHDPISTISLLRYLRDPFAAIERARRSGPLATSRFGPLVLSHTLAVDVLLDELFQPGFNDGLEAAGVTGGPFYELMRHSPINTGGDYHRRWRQLNARIFTPRSAERLRGFIHASAHTLIDDFASAERCELMSGFADRLPALALCKAIGIEDQDRDRVLGWVNDVGYGFNPAEIAAHIDQVDAAVSQLLEFGHQLISSRRREPRDDLVTRIAVEGAGDGFTDEQLSGHIIRLVHTGHETAKMQIGIMVFALCGDPRWEALAEDPSSAPIVVEALLRQRSAVSTLVRRALVDTEIGGCPVARGRDVVISVWGANRDPAVFPAGDVQAARADEPAHLAFGLGPHYCLGAALARVELQEALRALCDRLTHVRVEQDPVWRPPFGITGPTVLPLSFSERGQQSTGPQATGPASW